MRYPEVGVYNRDMRDVMGYSRRGCHLCDLVKETVTQVQAETDFQWREVDIDAVSNCGKSTPTRCPWFSSTQGIQVSAGRA